MKFKIGQKIKLTPFKGDFIGEILRISNKMCYVGSRGFTMWYSKDQLETFPIDCPEYIKCLLI